MSIWGDISHGINTAAHKVSTGLTHAAGELDPQLQHLKSNYAQLTGQYNGLRSEVQQAIQQFDQRNETYKIYAGLTGALLINSSMLRISDERFNSFLNLTKQPPPGLKNNNYLPPEVIKFINGQTGKAGPFLINGIYKIKELADEGWFDSLPSFSVHVELSIVNAVLESFGLGAFTNTGPGEVLTSALNFMNSFSPVGIVINVVNETNQYENAINQLHRENQKLETDLNQVKSAIDKLNQAIGKLQNAFITLVGQLNAIAPATFSWQFGPQSPDSAYLSAMHAAFSQYGIIAVIRYNWNNYQDRHPEGSVSDFKDILITMFPTKYTEVQFNEFINLVQRYVTNMH